MTETNKLLSIQPEDMDLSDMFRLWSQQNGTDVAVTIANLKEFLGVSDGAFLTQQYAAPSADGFSVTVARSNTWLVIVPADDYATGAITLPAGENMAEVSVTYTRAIGTLTVNSVGEDSIASTPTSFVANGSFTLRFDAVMKTWYMVA